MTQPVKPTRCRTTAPSPDLARRHVAPRPAHAGPPDRATALAVIGNQAAQRAVTGSPRRAAPAEEMDTEGKAGCGCGASRAAPMQWMSAPPSRSCGIEEGGGGPTYEENIVGEEGIGDYDLGYSEDETAVARQAGKSVRPDLQPWAGGAATIVCNGSGGYRVQLNGWAGAACGIEGCVRQHEQSHATDWAGRWPDGCKGKKDGDQIPLGGDGYAAFLKQSECTAYGVEENCISPIEKTATGTCKGTLTAHLKDTQAQKAKYC